MDDEVRIALIAQRLHGRDLAVDALADFVDESVPSLAVRFGHGFLLEVGHSWWNAVVVDVLIVQRGVADRTGNGRVIHTRTRSAEVFLPRHVVDADKSANRLIGGFTVWANV